MKICSFGAKKLFSKVERETLLQLEVAENVERCNPSKTFNTALYFPKAPGQTYQDLFEVEMLPFEKKSCVTKSKNYFAV